MWVEMAREVGRWQRQKRNVIGSLKSVAKDWDVVWDLVKEKDP